MPGLLSQCSSLMKFYTLFMRQTENPGSWGWRVVNSSACPKSLLYIPLRALTAFGKALFSLNTLENGHKNAKISMIKWYCVKIHLFLELRVLFSLKCDLAASWLFCSWSLRDILSAVKRKGSKAGFQCHFFVQHLSLWNKMSFSSTSPIGQLQFLRATVSLWMVNATLNYRNITLLNCS